MDTIRRRAFASLATVGAVALTAGAAAQTAAPTAPAPGTVTIAQLGTMITNMGYVVKPAADGKTFSAIVSGQFDLNMVFNIVSSDGSVIVFVFLQRFNPAQLARLNMAALLEENDISLSYFSLNKSGDDRLLYLQRDLAAPAVSPLTLRVVMNDIQKVTFQMENIWNMLKWTPAATP